jgi:putative DNA primase/helicase
LLVPRHLMGKLTELRNALLDHGADLPTDSETALRIVTAAVKRGPARKRVGTLTRRTGWNSMPNPTAFVLQETTIGDKAIVHERQFSPQPMVTMGDFVSWRKGLKTVCKASDLLVFCLSVAFAGPTLRLHREGTGLLFNLAGESGAGKTSMLKAALSVTGAPGEDAMISTNVTAAGLEQRSVEANDQILCLDEFGAALSTPRQAADLINMLAYQTREGRGKTRSSAGQSVLNYEKASWSVCVLTSSENTLVAMMGDGKREAGAELRYVDVPVAKRDDGGAFLRNGKKAGDSAASADLLAATIACSHGHALRKFVTFLMVDHNKRRKALLAYHDDFVQLIRERDPGRQKRFYENFAKVYAAGRLAIDAGIAPFKADRLKEAALSILDSVCSLNPGSGYYFKQSVERLISIGNDPEQCVTQQKGRPIANSSRKVIAVIHTHKGDARLFIPTKTFLNLFPHRSEEVVSHLRRAGVLHARLKVTTVQHAVTGLVKGTTRPSGYMMDWKKLRALAG